MVSVRLFRFASFSPADRPVERSGPDRADARARRCVPAPQPWLTHPPALWSCELLPGGPQGGVLAVAGSRVLYCNADG
jgi:hypothetical protein